MEWRGDELGKRFPRSHLDSTPGPIIMKGEDVGIGPESVEPDGDQILFFVTSPAISFLRPSGGRPARTQKMNLVNSRPGLSGSFDLILFPWVFESHRKQRRD